MEDVKCKSKSCILSANESGYCDRHDPNFKPVPTSGIGVTLMVIGIIAFIVGILVFFFSFTTSVLLIVSGALLLGISEIISLLQKLIHVNTNRSS